METALHTLSGHYVRQAADTDEKLIELWSHGRAKNTQGAYKRDIKLFLQFVDGKPLAMITVGDLQGFADTLAHLSPASKNRRLSAVKSLLTYGHRIGWLPFNVGAALKLGAVKNTLAERIMTLAEVTAILGAVTSNRDRVLVLLLYVAGLRASEVAGIQWKDVQSRHDAGQVTVQGKGGSTRAILLPASTWLELVALRNGSGGEDYVFQSRKGGGPLHRSQVLRIVQAAATAAGVQVSGKRSAVSPHWLRHAHASHSLDRGCPISLVQATLGHSNVATTGRYLHARPHDSSACYLGR